MEKKEFERLLQIFANVIQQSQLNDEYGIEMAYASIHFLFYLHCTQRNRRKLTTVLASRFMFHAKSCSVEHRKIHQREEPLQLKSIAFYFNMNIHYDINLKVILAKFMEMRYL